MRLKAPKPVSHVPASDQFDFVYGRFDLSAQWAIPYFATTMTMRQAANSLRLVNDFPGNESLAWKIDELYQRDIDWGRVQREIVPYLSSSEEPQFFNSLTIAFMPIRDNEVRKDFGGPEWECPELDGSFEKTLRVGPINVGYWSSWTSPNQAGARIGQIRWNPQQVFSVAIDGQHRLAALKLASKGFNERADRTQVPVLLLLLDERVGFRAPKGYKLVELMRTLFIALNKHSEKVSRPREILLDDLDPHALCVRAMVGDRITNGTQELSTGQLPLSLVDWHREQAKIDDGPYISTILGLDWIVEKTLRSKPIKDYASYGAVSKQLRAISLALGLDLNRPGSPTFERWKDLEQNAVEPFSYTGSWSHDKHEGELGEIVETFRGGWARGLIVVLTKFAPYAALINRRTGDGSLSTEFVNWYYLMKRKEQGGQASEEYNNFVSQLKSRKEHPLSQKTLQGYLDAVEVLKGDNLAFKVAFQRALILAYLEFFTIDGADLPGFDTDGEDDVEEDDSEADANEVQAKPNSTVGLYVKRAKQFVKGLNYLCESAPEILVVDSRFGDSFFWNGSLYNMTDNAIDFTLGASTRASHLVFIAAGLALCKEQNDEAILDGFDLFWAGLEDSDTGIHKKIRKTAEKKFADQKGAGGRIVMGRGDEYTLELALEEAKERTRWIWQKLDMPDDTFKQSKKAIPAKKKRK